MRERIILAPGANGNEIIRSLALQGINMINVKICVAGELARLALMRSGVHITSEFLSSRDEIVFTSKTIHNESYFAKATYSDICEIANAVRSMRCLTAVDDEAEQIHVTMSKGIFSEKNSALINTYDVYMRLLADENIIDSISLMRLAISKGCFIDADFYILDEYPLSPLEEAFLKTISFDSYKTISMIELYSLRISEIKIKDFKNCYGSPNEVETILQDIYGDSSVDKCVVAVTDSATYSQLFFDYALSYDLPITFGCGIPISNSNPAKLLKLYYYWTTAGFFSSNSLLEMLGSKSFDKRKFEEQFPNWGNLFSMGMFYNVLGSLRLTNDTEINRERIATFQKSLEIEAVSISSDDEHVKKVIAQKQECIPILEIVAKELALSPEEFISKYSYIRKGSETNSEKMLMKLDIAAASAIYDELSIIRKSGIEQSSDDIIKSTLSIRVCACSSEAGKLHVTTIDGAIETVRKNLYIAGLSASNYPSSPSENYLLLDADLELFGEKARYLTSDGKILRKREKLLSLVRLYSSCEANIHVSYSGLNVSELKHDNASSMIYELLREEHGTSISIKELDASIMKVDYFEPLILVTREIGNSYNHGDKVIADRHIDKKDYMVTCSIDRAYSPSALNAFFGCRRSFLLGNILDIPQPDDYKAFEVISVTDCGKIAHKLMERLANSSMSKDEFIKLSADAFDRFIEQNPPIVMETVLNERIDFIEMMELAYDNDPHREVVFKEEDICCTHHDSGVKIHGLPDRVEKLSDGTCLIVDFKSGRRVTHIQDDIETCLQIVIYAYLMEQQGLQVSGGEFRYIRLGESITCKYDDNMKQQLTDKLTEFRKAMASGEFPIAESDKEGTDPCKNCKYQSICGKV